MKFWDTSAIIPLCIEEPKSNEVKGILEADNLITVWWGTLVECYSAFSRLRREGLLNEEGEKQVGHLLSTLSRSWTAIMPSDEVRDIALRLLNAHPLRSADSLQLDAAMLWAGLRPKGHFFVCLNLRLKEAAKREGFIVIP